MTTVMKMRDWMGLFNTHLRVDYGIDIEEAGLDEEYLDSVWRQSYPYDPAAAVRAYGEKYGLTLMRDAAEGL